MLVSLNSFFVFPELYFAITNLYPGVSPPRISVRRSFEITNRIVVIAQPERIQSSSIRRLSAVAQPFSRRQGGDGAQLPWAQLFNSGGANREVDVLSIRYLNCNDADNLALHVEDWAATVAVRNRRCYLNDLAYIGNFADG